MPRQRDVMTRLLLIGADTAAQARLLVQAEVSRLDREAKPLVLLELDGEGLLLKAHQNSICFDPSRDGPRLWGALSPRLEPWLQLLELAPPDWLSPWMIPGVIDVLRLLVLAEQWQLAVERGAQLVVLLPPLRSSLALLRLAARGPALVEALWEPLLRWLRDIRQRLGQFELVLRLRLPAVDELNLTAPWRQRLQQLSEQLGPEADTEVRLAMALEQDDLTVLEPRLAALSLAGLPRQRLWLHSSSALTLPQGLQQRLGLPLLCSVGTAPPPPEELEAWQRAPLPSTAVAWIEAAGEWCCELLLPGVNGDGLQVHTSEQTLVVENPHHRLVLCMPAAWSGLSCRSAKLVSPRLTIALCSEPG